MQKINGVIRWGLIIALEIAAGILIMLIAFLVAVNVDMNKAERELITTVEYMCNQCNDSEIRDMASEAKSLLRVTESVEHIRWRMMADTEDRKSKVDSDVLKDYAKDSYLDGMLLLDQEGDVVAQYDSSGLGSETVLQMVDRDTIMDPMDFEEKTYAIRVEQEDESHVDLAAVARSDGDGVIVGYFYTSSGYARIVNNSIRAIVDGYTKKTNGTIVISRGDQVVIASDKSLEGTRVEDTEILKRIMERGTGNKLIHAKDRSSTFGHHFGLMEKSRDYYIYAFMDERQVFQTTFPNVLSIMFVYVLILIAVDMLLRKAESLYQETQLVSQKEYTKSLELALEQANKANAAKSSFLSRMSHDIRTPLNGILGLINIDEDHIDDRKLVLENHQKMRVSAKHLLSLINDVLQMSKLEDDTSVLTHEVISLIDLTQDIVAIIISRAVEAGIEWDYEKGKTEIMFPYIYGSPVHLRQIFLNIYGNCIKYNRPGGKITTIVDVYDEGDGMCSYEWTITDTGIGMNEEFVSHIFDPFVQEKNDARTTYQGIGLGMTIVKRLIDQMGGSITVDSEEGVGSTFVIRIPFEIAPAPEPEKNIPAEETDIHGMRIMLVEDNELNAEIGETLLTDQGAQVTVVSDGRQAVEMFAAQPEGAFDVILMDVMMPEMDGLTATRTIRAMERTDAGEIPIIAMTANAFRSDAERCMEAGMNAHLTKPLDISLIKKTICAQMKKK